MLSILRKARLKDKEMRVLLLGLDGAGKSSICAALLKEPLDKISPTLGFAIKTIRHDGYTLNIWDVGGQKTLRTYWRNYFERTDTLIWVVDATDRIRINDCRQELHNLLMEERLMGASLLVFNNKCDVESAMDDSEVQEILTHKWKIINSSAVSGQGLEAGIEWVLADAKSRDYESDLDERAMASESSPLLGSRERHDEPETPAPINTSSQAHQWIHDSVSTPFRHLADHVARYRVLYYIGVFSFIIDISFMMMIAPMARLSELALCRKHYLKYDPSLVDRNGDVPELLCKIKPVQEDLAKLTGVLTMLGLLPNKFGRKIICALSITGISLAFFWYFLVLQYYTIFPFGLVYTFPLFFIIGGGGNVIVALISAMIVDVTDTASRARVFLLLSTTIVAAGLVGPPIGSILLEKLGPGPAFLWSIPPRLLSILLLFLVPETRDMNKASTVISSAANHPIEPSEDASRSTSSTIAKFRKSISHLKKDVMPIMKQKPVVLGMFSLVVNHLTIPVIGMVVQYISVRFLWKFAKASYAIAFVSAVQIVLLTTVIPFVDSHLKRKYQSPEMANLVLSRGSIIFLVVGMILVGISPDAVGVFIGLFIYTCGSGYSPALRAYMTSLVPAKDTALLFTIIGVFDSFGGLFGAPLLALTFSTGIERGGMAIGLPFYFAAGVYVLSGVSIWSLVPPAKEFEESDDDDEVEEEEDDDDSDTITAENERQHVV